MSNCVETSEDVWGLATLSNAPNPVCLAEAWSEYVWWWASFNFSSVFLFSFDCTWLGRKKTKNKSDKENLDSARLPSVWILICTSGISQHSFCVFLTASLNINYKYFFSLSKMHLITSDWVRLGLMMFFFQLSNSSFHLLYLAFSSKAP